MHYIPKESLVRYYYIQLLWLQVESIVPGSLPSTIGPVILVVNKADGDEEVCMCHIILCSNHLPFVRPFFLLQRNRESFKVNLYCR